MRLLATTYMYFTTLNVRVVKYDPGLDPGSTWEARICGWD